MIEVLKINCENYEDFIELLKFRYVVYVSELFLIKINYMHNLLKMEFDEFDKYATFLVLKENGKILACVRIIEETKIGLPVYRKTDILKVFNNCNNVEIGRLIIKEDKRNTILFAILVKEIFNHLSGIKYDNILVDTFKESLSYRLLKRMGFRESEFLYFDDDFNISTLSTVLFFNKHEIEKILNGNSNKVQKSLLKYFSKTEDYMKQ